MYKKHIKRMMDFLLSLVGLVVFSPILSILAIVVRVKLGSPVLFKQERPGKDEKIFRLYKFRTMTDEKDDNGEMLPDEDRLTKFGQMLRASSLDELPELFNILKGEMSIVGPRPLAVQYLPYYTDEERHRHDVRPGLTGLAQVHGRNSISWEERFAFDVDYVREISFLRDARIVIDTIVTVLRREDIGVRGVDAPLDFDVYRKQQWEEMAK